MIRFLTSWEQILHDLDMHLKAMHEDIEAVIISFSQFLGF